MRPVDLLRLVLVLAKFPAVWKNFFGTSGGPRVVLLGGIRLSASSAPPCSKSSRIEPRSRTTISSASIGNRPGVAESDERHAADRSRAHLARALTVGRKHRVEDLRHVAAWRTSVTRRPAWARRRRREGGRARSPSRSSGSTITGNGSARARRAPPARRQDLPRESGHAGPELRQLGRMVTEARTTAASSRARPGMTSRPVRCCGTARGGPCTETRTARPVEPSSRMLRAPARRSRTS